MSSIHPAEPPRSSEGRKVFSSVQMKKQPQMQAVIQVIDLTEIIRIKRRKQAPVHIYRLVLHRYECPTLMIFAQIQNPCVHQWPPN